MVLSTAEAKKEYFLTTSDLHDLPYETLYAGFGTGRATNVYSEEDLERKAIDKHGQAGYAKKVAARRKRAENKRKREEDAARAEADALAANPALAAKKRQEEEARGENRERNMRIQGRPWKLVMTGPEGVAGTKAELAFRDFPPLGMGCDHIDCGDCDSPAYSFGNIHDFKGKSSEEDAEMKFVTKWKVCGHRYTGTLSVKVKPSDKEEKTDDHHDEKQKENNEPSTLMVEGHFDSGYSGQGCRSWSFKGYRD